MSKFAAWSYNWTPNNFGIRIQMVGVETHQVRQYIDMGQQKETCYSGYEVHVSSTVPLPGWDKENILDENPNSAWSSIPSSAESAEWFAFWFDLRRINCLELTPRRVGGTAYCFPEKIEIRYSAGPNHWESIREVNLPDPGNRPGSILISLDQTVDTDGLQIIAKRLRVDDYHNYYFQMAGARACYRTLVFDEAGTRAAVERFPASLFIFGDEPDLYLPADEYANVYDKFVATIKSGSATARVSPAGFTFANGIFGSTHTAYAQKFFLAKNAPVDEWRFHNFYWPDSYATWEADVRLARAWSREHGAPMVLGSFGSPDDGLAGVDMRPYQQRAMTMLAQEPDIVEAVWWSLDVPHAHNLVDSNGKLTQDGELFVQLM